jgi:hypothetical protein
LIQSIDIVCILQILSESFLVGYILNLNELDWLSNLFSSVFVDPSMRSISKLPFLLGNGAEIPVSVFSLVREKRPSQPVKLDSKTNEIVERSAFFAKIKPEEVNGDATENGEGQQLASFSSLVVGDENAENGNKIPPSRRLKLEQVFVLNEKYQ